MRDPKKTTVREIMTEDILTFRDDHRLILTFRDDEPVDEAIGLLEEYRITGAPVLNGSDECIGVFTRADALKRRAEEDELGTMAPGDLMDIAAAGPAESAEPAEFVPGSDTEEVLLERETVGQWMSANVVSVRPDTPVEEAARRMASEGVHRLLVMEGKRLRGILTALDLAGFLAGMRPEDIHQIEGKVREATGRKRKGH
jgi:CBS domain-containing protein